MGTVIIKNLSSLDETAALIRVAYYMNGNKEDAEHGGVIVKEDTSKRDEAANIKRFIVYER